MTLEEMSSHEVACSECRKPISTIPTWLAHAKVNFQCEECRQRHPRIPGMNDLEPRRVATEEIDELADGDEVVDEDEEVDEELEADASAD